MKDEKKELSFRQKLAVSTLAVFTFLLFVVLIANMKNNLNKPFEYKAEDSGSICSDGTICPTGSSDEELSQMDTDKDGLSDWDELNIYNTSPYLEDSDSDGFLDGEEIAKGLNPNCFKEQDCNMGGILLQDESVTNTDLSTQNSELLNILSELDLLAESEDGTIIETNLEIKKEEVDYTDEELQNILNGEGGAGELRNLLLKAGMDKDVLDQIDDKTLIQSYQEILQGS